MNNEIFEMADRLKAAKEHKKELDAQVKEVNAEIEQLDLALSDAMAEQEVERFSWNGSTFYLNTRLFASPAAGRKDENANTLASFVKEQKAANGDEIPEWLAGVVSAYEKVTVGVRKG